MSRRENPRPIGATRTPDTPRPEKVAPKRETGAQISQIKKSSQIRSWARHHRQVALDSLLRLVRAPFATLMTLGVIAIALSLPTGLYLFLTNAQLVTSNWDGSAQISLYLQESLTSEQGDKLAQQIEKRGDVGEVQFISKEQALLEFKALSGFGEALDYLEDNPLPAVIVVRPASGLLLEQQEILLRDLQGFTGVDEAQLDLAWVKRLYYIMQLGQKAVSGLAAVLGIAVLLVIGNTIRLAIESRRQEIVVVKLVGGTNAFVRRPFLYTGVWYGLGGSLLSWCLLTLSLLWLEQPVQSLANAYASDFNLMGLNQEDTLSLLLLGAVLGWLGAWLAVTRHISAIEPR